MDNKKNKGDQVMGKLISVMLILMFAGSMLFAEQASAKSKYGTRGCDTWEEQVKV